MNARHRFRKTRPFVGLLWLSAVLTLLASPARSAPAAKHPSHDIRVSVVRYQGRNFHVVRLPRCQHLEAVITNEPAGETLARAKQRMGGIASLTGAFHDPHSLALADFLQRDGAIESGATTGRWLLVITPDGQLNITGDYA